MRLDWTAYVVGLVIVSLLGAAAYFGLWLCGMPARPIGYAGAPLVALAVWHLAFIVGKSVKGA